MPPVVLLVLSKAVPEIQNGLLWPLHQFTSHHVHGRWNISAHCALPQGERHALSSKLEPTWRYSPYQSAHHSYQAVLFQELHDGECMLVMTLAGG